MSFTLPEYFSVLCSLLESLVKWNRNGNQCLRVRVILLVSFMLWSHFACFVLFFLYQETSPFIQALVGKLVAGAPSACRRPRLHILSLGFAQMSAFYTVYALCLRETLAATNSCRPNTIYVCSTSVFTIRCLQFKERKLDRIEELFLCKRRVTGVSIQ